MAMLRRNEGATETAARDSSSRAAISAGGLVSDEDLALYDAKAETMLSPACGRWIARGRLQAGDPRLM
jgi:hypothetical protein